MATFGNLSDRLAETFKNLRTKGKLSAADVDGTVREIRRALLDADVALEVVKDFTGKVRERALGDEVSKALNPAQQVVKIVNEELVEILGGQQRRLEFAKKPPTIIMLAGLQGAGKTTLAGKLAKWLAKDGHTPILVAADLQRPNAVTQLEVVGAQAGVPVYAPEPGNGVGNPVKVARDGVKYAQQKMHDVVIVDTAGRLGVDAEMMKQAADIRTAIDPDEVLFVIDAMIGQDAVATAKAFQDGVDFTGVVLSKLDGDARGGAALSVASITGRPIMFASTGESLDDFEPFHPDRMASRILDLGDILTLIEQAQGAFDEDEARKMAEKFSTDSFTLDDFLGQMQQLRNMGSIKKMMSMLPGAGAMKQQLENFDEREIVRTEAIIQSMTKAERTTPKLLNGSRRLRIARGAGSTVTEVNQLVSRFEQAAKMMKTVAKGGMPNIPGMGPVPGGMGGGGRGKPQPKKKGSKSGNPAKRAAENLAIASGEKPAGAGPGAGGGTGFGLGGARKAGGPTEDEMAALQKMLGR
ncbi:signal recognition particle protein [Cryobacterium sp. TMT1-62]|uniref:Signal recognition particle protein n=1 Tax=Cryobacterium sandaracinum TaxID=1259247 RepID=A0ABY2J9Y9_9MICO|nr:MULTISPECIES: signal recognition particle protein [Cryobacterium]TFC33180.1 signal recognition particle protein [Cryobacterium sp. TMT2-14]TFC51536.1 signal recognition particle protein [Cryobacterium sp. TMT2-17-1]TFC71747.1 signal recognition particle protein [Cryobacterium sp. TMT2-4]TFD01771.1 signal recognition particle protein [Cryobacterium sandaracinum]TFD31038.1 signal recognition particle protein [Cryobacterium sp. TMT1-19]